MVRQAISYAVDRAALVNQLYRGTHKPAFSPLEQGMPGYHMSVDALSIYDPKRARSVLERAGWVVGPDGIREKDGRRLKVNAASTGRQETLFVLRDQLEEIGIELAPAALAAQGRDTVGGGQDHYNMLLTCLYWPDPQFLTGWFSEESNWIGYDNPKLGDLFQKAERATDPEERATIYRRAQDFLIIDAACIPLFGKSVVLGMHNKVEKIGYSTEGYPVFYEAFISE
jgi:peptide/nickel transport system substrate-binding protein